MNPSGDLAAAWVTATGVVQASVRPAGGTFGPVADLSAAGAVNPDVAIDGAGGAVVVWEIPGSSAPSLIQASVRPPGAAFGPTQNLSVSGDESREPQVAMDPAGDAVAVWLKSGNIVQASARPAGGSFAGPFTLSPGEQAQQPPHVAMDRSGNAVVVWTNTDIRVRASMRRVGSSFGGSTFSSAANVFTGTFGVLGARVAMSASGEAVAVWQTVTGGGASTINSASSVGGAPFGPVLLVSPTGQPLTNPQVGINAAGEAIAVWQRAVASTFYVHSAIRPSGGGWAPRADLPNAGPFTQAPRPQIAMSPAGDAIVAWQGSTGANTIVQALTRVGGGIFSGLITNVSVAGADAKPPRVAIDDDGDGVATWVRGTTAQAAGYDAAPPQLRGLTVPTAAIAQSPTAWSVSPVDVWSGVASTMWSFGEGVPVVGASATHTYPSAGTYPVTVTARDGLGNERTTATAISVAQPFVPEADDDQDRFGASVDCNDHNAAIHPGAKEIPRNNIDENCDRKDDDYQYLPTTISLTTSRIPPSRSLLLTVLSVRNAVAGSTIRLTCSGRLACRAFKTVKRSITKAAARRDFSRLLPKRRLRPGAKFEVTVTKSGLVGRVVRLTIFAKKRASVSNLCVDPGKTKAATCRR